MDNSPVTIELPFPISANVYWGHRAVPKKVMGKTKWIVQVYVTAEARKYKNLVRAICQQHGITPRAGRVRIVVMAYMPSTDRDLGNTSKVLEDALEGALYVNDNQIAISHYERFEAKSPKRENAKVLVTVESINPC